MSGLRAFPCLIPGPGLRSRSLFASPRSGGALLTSTSGPGFHLMLPFITSYKSVQVLWGWAGLRDAPGCGVGGEMRARGGAVRSCPRRNVSSVVFRPRCRPMR